jgi:hypothetical protein
MYIFRLKSILGRLRRVTCIKFASYERFFCCTGYMSGYKQKYGGRIAIKRRLNKSKWLM